MAKVGVVLSGCGVYDGAEIHESVCTILALDRAKSEIRFMAPDIHQNLNRDETLVFDTEAWRPEGTHKVSSHLVSAVTIRGRLAGILSLASSERLPFDAWDQAVVKRFLPVTAFACDAFLNPKDNRGLHG